MTWILIATLFYHGQTSISIQRFESENLCNKAGIASKEFIAPKENAMIKFEYKCENLIKIN